MKSLLLKAGAVGITISFVAISLSFPTQAAEKKNFVFSKKDTKLISSMNLNPPQDKNNEIVQWVRQVIISDHTEPHLINAEITVYGTTDRLTYGGVINGLGYDVVKTKEGDIFYYRWQYIGLITVPHETNWEIEYERKIQFIGGTGKYGNVKGAGICKGKNTPAGHVEKCEGEWQY